MIIDVDHIVKKGIGRVPNVRDKSVFSPSDIGQCMRYLYYSYTLPREEKEEKLKVFAIGNKVHDIIKEAFVQYNKVYGDFKDMQFEYPIEISIDDFKIKGRADILLTLFDNSKVVIEIKSTSDISKILTPDESHVWQTIFYIKATNASQGIIAYVEKNNMKIKQFDVYMNEDIYSQILARFLRLKEFLKTNTLPPAEYYFDKNKSWMCKNCPYREECFSHLAEENF